MEHILGPREGDVLGIQATLTTGRSRRPSRPVSLETALRVTVWENGRF
jgi:hypothetical protein